MKPVTIWYSQETIDKIKVWVYHHLEDGHSDADKPIVLKDENDVEFKSQHGWKGLAWKKELCYLQNNVVIHK